VTEPRFAIEISADPPDAVTVRLSGELDLAARPVVNERVTGVLEEHVTIERVVVDLGKVKFCDSSGLGALLDIRRTADRFGATTVLGAPSPGVARVLDIAGIDELFPRE
jgi:anti-sigma B factor antagonist